MESKRTPNTTAELKPGPQNFVSAGPNASETTAGPLSNTTTGFKQEIVSLISGKPQLSTLQSETLTESVHKKPDSHLPFYALGALVLALITLAMTMAITRRRRAVLKERLEKLQTTSMRPNPCYVEQSSVRAALPSNNCPLPGPPSPSVRPKTLTIAPVTPQSQTSVCTASSALHQHWPIGSLPHGIRTSLEIAVDERFEIDRRRVLGGKKLGKNTSFWFLQLLLLT